MIKNLPAYCSLKSIKKNNSILNLKELLKFGNDPGLDFHVKFIYNWLANDIFL